MSSPSLPPPKPYTPNQLKTLYPEPLSLVLVHILLRHGERTPIIARLPKTGLPALWPLCAASNSVTSPILDPDTGEISHLQWRRRYEAVETDADGRDTAPRVAQTPGTRHGGGGAQDGLCELGTLTDRGRETTFRLGRHLRTLYVEQLAFLPHTLDLTAPPIYLRTTPMARTHESLQQAFTGLYPPTATSPPNALPTIHTRPARSETLFPNETHCPRYAQLMRAFRLRASETLDTSPSVTRAERLLDPYLPPLGPARKRRFGVSDAQTHIIGLMDTINSVTAHTGTPGAESISLPKVFHDAEMRKTLEAACSTEYFGGYALSREYRMLGVGALMGDLLARMTGAVQGLEAPPLRMTLNGCHDTTIAGVLASLGCLPKDTWPPFTSHLAIELFRANTQQPPTSSAPAQQPSLLSRVFSSKGPEPISRRPLSSLNAQEKSSLGDHYVRIRYNDTPVTVPGCALPGNHLPGDPTFCKLVSDFASGNL